MSETPNTEKPVESTPEKKPTAIKAGANPAKAKAGANPAKAKAGTNPAKKSVAKPTAPKPAAPSGANPEEKPEQQEKVQLVFSKFTPTYISSWYDPDQPVCCICRGSFLDPCSECYVKGITDACPVATGRCGHQYHLHCIEKWITRSNTCPLDGDKWEQV